MGPLVRRDQSSGRLRWAISATSARRSCAAARGSRAGGGRRCRATSRSSTPSSSVAAAELVGVVGEQHDQVARHLLAPAPARPRRKSISLPSVPRTRGADLVVVDELGRVLDQRLLGVVERAEPVRERDDQRGERDRVLDPRLLVEDPRLDRAQVRVRAHVPPQERVVLDRAGAHHQLDAVREDLPGAVVGRDPLAREGAEDRHARATSARCRSPSRRASWPTARAAAAGSGGCRRRRRSPGRGPRSRRGRGCRR